MSHGRSEVSFKNDYGQKIFVAYMRRDFSCLAECGDLWEVKGWIGLDPGETEYRANPTENQWFYYYAEAVDGAFWSGPFVVEVTTPKFSTCSCLDHAGAWYAAPMQELDTVKWAGVRFIP